jgi:hypothetical protein
MLLWLFEDLEPPNSLGNLGTVQHRRYQRVESCIVSTRGENDDLESPLFPLWFLSNSADATILFDSFTHI